MALNFKLDRIDLKILNALQANGRLTNKDLAEQVGLSASPSLVRVKRLEDQGLISSYMGIIDIKRLTGCVFVISQFYLRDADARSAKRLEEYLLGLPQTCEFYDVNGHCDYIARFACRGTDDYYEIARSILDDETFRVRQISSFVILRELKRFHGYSVDYLAQPGTPV